MGMSVGLPDALTDITMWGHSLHEDAVSDTQVG